MSCTNLKTELTLLSALEDVPALVEDYIDVVDEIMRLHGFDLDICQFPSVHQPYGAASRPHPVRALQV